MSDVAVSEVLPGMLRPRSRVDLLMSDRQGIEIDYCPKCRGVSLGCGELDKIIERSVHHAARLIALTALLILAGVAGAQAQGDPKMALEDIPMGLDPLPGFADPDGAQRHCPGDVVVWPDPATGYYHPPRSSRFAAARGGFACLRDAIGAGYWDTNPLAGAPGRGWDFPIDPALRPNLGS